MSDISQRKARVRLEKDLNLIIAKTDTRGKKLFTFDMLGQFMRSIGIYKILYNSKYETHSLHTGELKFDDKKNHSPAFMRRQRKEHEFHTNLWKLLDSNDYGEISTELLKELLVLLYDTNYPAAELISDVKSKICANNIISVVRGCVRHICGNQ